MTASLCGEGTLGLCVPETSVPHGPGGGVQKVPWPTHLLLRDQHLPLGVPSPEHARSQQVGLLALIPASGKETDVSTLWPLPPGPGGVISYLLILQRLRDRESLLQGHLGVRDTVGRDVSSDLPDSHVRAAHPTSLLFMKSTMLCLSLPMCKMGTIVALTSQAFED